jgi:hypothetical protein
MSDKKIAVFGVYSTGPDAERATQALNAAGFPASQTSTFSAVDAVGGALIDMGLSEYEAALYDAHLQHGGVLLSVHCVTPGEIMRAKEVMTSTEAEHISSSGESMVETMKMPAAVADQ